MRGLRTPSGRRTADHALEAATVSDHLHGPALAALLTLETLDASHLLLRLEVSRPAHRSVGPKHWSPRRALPHRPIVERQMVPLVVRATHAQEPSGSGRSTVGARTHVRPQA